MPIRSRLALWYGGLTGTVVALSCLVIYAAHTRAHYDELDLALVGAAGHVSGELADEPPGERSLAAMLSVPTRPEVAIRAYGPDGRELASSPGAARAPGADPRRVLDEPSGPAFDPVAGLGPNLVGVDAGGGAFGIADGSGARWRVYVVPVSGPARYVEAATPLDGLDASIARFRRLVALLTVIATAGTLAAAALLAGRALRPVAALNETAGSIARSRDFGRRVPGGARQDELGRLAETFNGMLESLEGAYQAQKRFVADASHELRAPLTAIQGNLELLQRHPDRSPSEQREALNEANREAQRLSNLVGDLLALARADTGVSLRRERVELDRVVLDVLATARHMVSGQRVELVDLEPAVVEGEADRLEQLLLILLDNALKYTPPGGQVTLDLRRDDSAVEVSVRDTGVGIPPEDLAHVFERFYRADPARARDPGGTGLGLSIARWIAEQHGGEISLYSKPAEGTTATVRLPLFP